MNEAETETETETEIEIEKKEIIHIFMDGIEIVVVGFFFCWLLPFVKKIH